MKNNIVVDVVLYYDGTVYVPSEKEAEYVCEGIEVSGFDEAEEAWVSYLNYEGKKKYALLKSKKINGADNVSLINGVWYKTSRLTIEEGTFQLADGNFAIGKLGSSHNPVYDSYVTLAAYENILKTSGEANSEEQ